MARGSVHRFTVPRQQDWLFRRETGFLGPATSDAEEVQVCQQAIPVVYLLHGSKGVSPEDCLIFHCHGGGYLSSTFRSHEAYLRGWGERTRIPIHCTDYRLSPEHPFPASIQDLLDTYLFITSGSEEAVRLLGFQPKRIILTGDSAGGNMALVLALAISAIGKQQPEGKKVQQPVGMALQYPNGNPSVERTAARAMSVIDTTITLAGLGQAAGAYFGVDPPSASSPSDKHHPQQAWFRSADFVPLSRRMMQRMRANPHYNPLISQEFADLKHLPLYITAAEFDPLIDDAVAIGRCWRGPLTMDLAKRMPHSFMSYGCEIPDVAQAIEGVISRIAQALGIGLSGK